MLRKMVASVVVVDIDPTVAEFAIDLRLNRHLKFPNALIAATALSLQALLVTNDQAFNRVNGLLLEAVWVRRHFQVTPTEPLHLGPLKTEG